MKKGLSFLDRKPEREVAILSQNRKKSAEEIDYGRYLFEVKKQPMTTVAAVLNVSIETVKRWRKEGNWVNPRTSKKQQDFIANFNREKFLQLATEKGMSLERATKLLIKGMTKPADEIKDENGRVLASSPDYNTRHKFQKDFWTMAGMIGGSGKGLEVNNNGGGSVNIQVNIPEKEATTHERGTSEGENE